MIRNPFLIVFLLFLVLIRAEMVSIRIVDSPQKTPEPPRPDRTPPASSSFPEPVVVNEPASLLPLNGKCFEMVDQEYEIKFCPFQNVTQRRHITPDAEPVTLGIFEGIDGTYQMSFSQGLACSNGFRRRTVVSMGCHPFRHLFEYSEPQVCVYEMHFGCPELCGDHFSFPRDSFEISDNVSSQVENYINNQVQKARKIAVELQSSVDDLLECSRFVSGSISSIESFPCLALLQKMKVDVVIPLNNA